jgi:hypothetical protein
MELVMRPTSSSRPGSIGSVEMRSASKALVFDFDKTLLMACRMTSDRVLGARMETVLLATIISI